MGSDSTRREFLRTGAVATLATAMGTPGCGTRAPSTQGSTFYSNLGVRTVVNGIGTVTTLGGSIMPPEVIEAMVEASHHFVDLPELQQKAGRYIADLVSVPSAMITCGAASAITVGTAACVAAGDPEKLRALPDTSGMRNEIIQQKAHRSGYETQMWLAGTKTLWVETRQELERVIGERTAMMFFLNKADPDGQIRRQEWIQVAREHGIPTMNDAAADIPPPERLRSYVDEGFDLVIFSGGKALLGPQCTGLLLGNASLIEAAQQAISPHGGIGRGMKVGKEEIVGLVAAVERYLQLDHEAERRELDKRADRVIEALGTLLGIQTERNVPEIANHVPHVLVKWDPSERGFEAAEVVRKLREGEPPIAVSSIDPDMLRISMWMLKPGEDRVLARRLQEVLGS